MTNRKVFNALEDVRFRRATRGTSVRKVKFVEVPLDTYTITGSSSDADFKTFLLAQPILDPLKTYRVTLDLREGTAGRLKLNTASSDSPYFYYGRMYTVFMIGLSHNIHAQTNQGSSKYIGNATIKIEEVIYDHPDGDLLLVDHPNNIPRLDHDKDGNLKGVLLEGTSTNRLTNSRLDKGWTINGSQEHEKTDPMGTSEASLIGIEEGGDYIYQTATVTPTKEYTASWFMKKGTAEKYIYSFYDETNGSFVSRTLYDIYDGEEVLDGWYRYSVSVTAPAGCTSLRVYPLRADLSGGFEAGTVGTTTLWGVQFEEKGFATSLIRTNDATAQRNADSLDMRVASFGFNVFEGSIIAEFRLTDDVSGLQKALFSIDDGTNQNRIRAVIDSGDNPRYVMNKEGSSTIAISDNSTTVEGPIVKVGIAFKNGSHEMAVNGESVITSTTSGTLPKNPTYLIIGRNSYASTGEVVSGHIRNLRYLPKRISSEKLQGLTKV